MQEFKFIKLVEYFLENPYKEMYLRELARKLKISPFASKKYTDLLVKENLVLVERKANLKYLKANMNSLVFKHLKISRNLFLISKSKLIDFLKESVSNLSSIVLFGSLAKGEDDDKSDTDLLIIGKDKHLSLSKFEEELGREITPHFFSWNEWNKKAKEDNPFYFEVINKGIPLFGEIPLIRWK